jgi:molybdenum cofactor cytidylyltransferase
MSNRKDIKKIGVIILAAGGSSRMGQPKQLMRFQNKSLLQNIIDQSQKALSFTSYVLVLGAYAEEIQNSIDPGEFNVIINDNWKKGMAGSIRKGVEGLLAIEPELESILILLSDQPFVTSKLILELIETHLRQGKEITACKYEDAVGVPAIFNRHLFNELCLLEGDRGARMLIKKYAERLAVLSFDLGSIDVDLPDDYNRLLNFSK